MICKKITSNILHLKFQDQVVMAKTMLRFQECYESPNPKFRNNTFSLSEFKKWYRTTRNHGKFSYYTDWGGFNVPGYVFKPFLTGQFKNLTRREKRVLNIIKNTDLDKTYIIATLKNNDSLRHEIAHGLFYTNSRYKNGTLQILKSAKLSKLKKYLLKMGYCKEVLNDECHAYLLDEAENFYKVFKIPNGLKIQSQLQKLYNNYI